MIRKIPNALWISGTALIVLSWVHVVPHKVGWVGWGVALFGTLLSFAGRRAPGPAPSPAPSVAAQLDELSRQRDRGDVTEEEFLRRKRALLGEQP
jgi:hypothetical protein